MENEKNIKKILIAKNKARKKTNYKAKRGIHD